MDWLSQIPAAVWAALLTPLIMALLMRTAKSPVHPDPDGWTRLRPSIGAYVLGLLFVMAALLFTAMPALALVGQGSLTSWVLVLLGPPLAALMWYGAYGTFVVGVRFNGDGIVYRGLLKRLLVPWKEVRRIKDSGLGSYISTDQGRLIAWKYFRGFRELLEEAERHGIEIDPRARS